MPYGYSGWYEPRTPPWAEEMWYDCPSPPPRISEEELEDAMLEKPIDEFKRLLRKYRKQAGFNDDTFTDLELHLKAIAADKPECLQFFIDEVGNYIYDDIFGRIEDECFPHKGFISVETVRIILENTDEMLDPIEVVLNKQNKDTGRTILMLAILWKDKEMIELLMDYNADTLVEDCDGQTAWFYACDMDMLETLSELKPLQEFCPNCEGHEDSTLTEDSALNDDVPNHEDCFPALQNLILNYDEELFAEDSDGYNVMMYAVKHNRSSNVKFLLEQGVQPRAGEIVDFNILNVIKDIESPTKLKTLDWLTIFIESPKSLLFLNRWRANSRDLLKWIIEQDDLDSLQYLMARNWPQLCETSGQEEDILLYASSFRPQTQCFEYILERNKAIMDKHFNLIFLRVCHAANAEHLQLLLSSGQEFSARVLFEPIQEILTHAFFSEQNFLQLRDKMHISDANNKSFREYRLDCVRCVTILLNHEKQRINMDSLILNMYDRGMTSITCKSWDDERIYYETGVVFCIFEVVYQSFTGDGYSQFYSPMLKSSAIINSIKRLWWEHADDKLQVYKKFKGPKSLTDRACVVIRSIVRCPVRLSIQRLPLSSELIELLSLSRIQPTMSDLNSYIRLGTRV